MEAVPLSSRPSSGKAGLPRISKILQEAHKHSYTAPINSDSITSIAYSLTALGFPHDPDSTFYATKTNVADVTDEGLSLGQAYDAAMRVTSIANPSKGLPLRVEMQHFTEVGPSLEKFRDAVRDAVTNGAALIVQFDVALAHFGPGVSSVCAEADEDSFALLADYVMEADEAIIVDPANHRWMKIWRCPLPRLYKAMQAIDPRSTLPRGAICISRLDSPSFALNPVTSVGRFTPPIDQLAHWRLKQDSDLSLHNIIPLVHDKYINLNAGVIALALALNTQGYVGDQISYDSIFHVAELPISASQSSFALEKTHATAVIFITRKELPLFVESFSGALMSEKAFHDFCTDSTSRKDFWKYESIVLCYDGNSLDMAKIEDGEKIHGWSYSAIQYSMLVDEMDGILIMATTVPKKRGRFWSCSVSWMYQALANDRGGVMRIASTAKGACGILGEPSFTVASVPSEPYTGLNPLKGDTCKRKVCDCCWSLPEGLGVASWKPQSQLLKEGFSVRRDARTKSSKNLITDASTSRLPYGAEPLESLSMALGSMGFPFSADLICAGSRVPLRDALAIRLTLGQLYDLSRAFLRRAGLPFRCEVVHFDDGTVDLSSFKAFLENASRPPFQDAFIFAFNVKMAYGEAPEDFLDLGRAHYALFKIFNADTGMVTLADTRPDDFGEEKQVEVSRLFEAMRDKEGGHKSLTKAGRRRGLMRIVMHASKLFPDIPTVPLLNLGRQETPPWDMQFWEIADLDHLSFVQFQQPLNCCNNTALAYATSALGFPTTVDSVFEVVKPSIRSVTSIGLTLAETYEVAAEYFAKTGLPLRAEVVHFDQGTVSEELFREELRRANDDKGDIHIMNFKVNMAHRAENVGGGHYALLGAYLAETDEILMADVNPMKYLRYWKCPLTCMYRAMCDPDSDSKRARGYLRIALQSAPPMKIGGVAHISADLYQYMAAAHISSGMRVSRQD